MVQNEWGVWAWGVDMLLGWEVGRGRGWMLHFNRLTKVSVMISSGVHQPSLLFTGKSTDTQGDGRLARAGTRAPGLRSSPSDAGHDCGRQAQEAWLSGTRHPLCASPHTLGGLFLGCGSPTLPCLGR